jgi:hypothetical protein
VWNVESLYTLDSDVDGPDKQYIVYMRLERDSCLHDLHLLKSPFCQCGPDFEDFTHLVLICLLMPPRLPDWPASTYTLRQLLDN